MPSLRRPSVPPREGIPSLAVRGGRPSVSAAAADQAPAGDLPDQAGIDLWAGACLLGPTAPDLAEALGLYDIVFEFDLTPNRPDCLSVIGIAREIAAIQKTPLNYPDYTIEDKANAIHNISSVKIEAPDHCPRYSARLVETVKVEASPFWLQDRLLSIGLRPINNIVDITNFVMMETGQPLHAFDFDNLAEHRIVVRTAHDNEPFTTLDGKARHMAQDMLMICDGEKAVGIGGVMGGLNSEIESDTRRVLNTATPEDVKHHVREQIEIFAPGGGFVFNTIHNIQSEVPPENLMAMWETLQEYGIYS